MNKTILLFFILIGITTVSCQAQVTDADTLRTLHKCDSTLIIDVRTVVEFEEEHIEGSINIPLDIVTDSATYLSKYKSIILVCKSGGRSLKAKKRLEEECFLKNLYNGGGWKSLDELLNRKKEEE